MIAGGSGFIGTALAGALRDRGVLRTLSTLTKCFLGGRVGSGRRYISWIHIDDLCDIFIRAIEDENLCRHVHRLRRDAGDQRGFHVPSAARIAARGVRDTARRP
jgi:NAD dependent epimerase/dehydratase family enzyme